MPQRRRTSRLGRGLDGRRYWDTAGAATWTNNLQYRIEYRMVHLNITLDEELYHRLKAKAPPNKLSAFIADALRARLGPDVEELARAYRDAAKEPWL
jgi:hypothetical protein